LEAWAVLISIVANLWKKVFFRSKIPRPELDQNSDPDQLQNENYFKRLLIRNLPVPVPTKFGALLVYLLTSGSKALCSIRIHNSDLNFRL